MALFRQQQARAADALPTPYLNARREWEERYGCLVAREANWRAMAFLMGFIALAAVGALAWIGARSQVVPYMVERDATGRVTAVARAEVASPPDRSIIRTTLATWVESAFGVIADGMAEKKAIERVYAHLLQGSPAYGELNRYYADPRYQPFERAKTETVSVEVNSAVPLSAQTWQVDWTERRRPRGATGTGGPETRRMRAIIRVQIVAPTSEREVLRNPLGVYVQEINWTQQL